VKDSEDAVRTACRGAAGRPQLLRDDALCHLKFEIGQIEVFRDDTGLLLKCKTQSGLTGRQTFWR